MQRSLRCHVALALTSLTACAAPPVDPTPFPSTDPSHAVTAEDPIDPPSDRLRTAATDLLGAPPAHWSAACAEVQGLTRSVAPATTATALLDALADQPDGAGVQPTLALLGNLDLPRTRRALLRLATASPPVTPHAADAALALGRGSSDPAMIDPLRELVDDSSAPRILRTCAAATLLDWDQPRLAAPFLHAVLLGGTPRGQDAMRRTGLADDTRWALERSIAIAAIDRWAGKSQAYDLDPDLPWPLLGRRADRFLTEALQSGR